MIIKELEKKIIELIPSKTIKTEIVKQQYHFGEIDLVQIIIEFARYWDEMISLLEEIIQYLDSSKLIQYVEDIIKCEKKSYQDFISNSPNYVYDIVIDNNISSSYLVPNYNSIKKTIESYLENYNEFIDNDKEINVSVYKRKISNRQTAKEIDENENQEIKLDRNNRIVRIDSNWIDPEDYDIEFNSIKYPPIFKKYELVSLDLKYYDNIDDYKEKEYAEGKNVCYLIESFGNMNEKNGEACLLYLNSELVKYRNIDLIDEQGHLSYFNNHFHLNFGYLEKVDLNSISEKIKNDYNYTYKELIKISTKKNLHSN